MYDDDTEVSKLVIGVLEKEVEYAKSCLHHDTGHISQVLVDAPY